LPLKNVSRGQQFHFAVNGKAVSGIITGSRNHHPQFVSVGVETKEFIGYDAQLTIPDCPHAGPSNANPIPNGRYVGVILKIPLSCVEASTIGK